MGVHRAIVNLALGKQMTNEVSRRLWDEIAEVAGGRADPLLRALEVALFLEDSLEITIPVEIIDALPGEDRATERVIEAGAEAT